MPSLSLFDALLGPALVLPITLLIYLLLVWGQRAPDSKWKADEQIGIKIIAAALILLGTVLFATGLQGLLHLLLTFKEFGAKLKEILPHLLVGAVTLGAAVLFVIPRTNHEQFPKALRLTTGAITLIGTLATIWGLDSLLVTVFKWPGWSPVANALTTLLTAAIVTLGAGYFFARLSGVALPAIPLPTQPSQPMQGQPMQGQPMQGQPMQGQYPQQQQYATQGQVPGYPPQQQQQPQQGYAQTQYPPQQGQQPPYGR
jgi:hypothetical protein